MITNYLLEIYKTEDGFFSPGEGEYGTHYTREYLEEILNSIPTIEKHLTSLLK